jgi:class 3 adenylate cyclase
MELLAERDPEEARKILDPVLEIMMEAVHRYEGTVNQVMGDGIMALFGAPIAHEDHAVPACYAALRIQEAVGRSHERGLAAYSDSISIRVSAIVPSSEKITAPVGVNTWILNGPIQPPLRASKCSVPTTFRLPALWPAPAAVPNSAKNV